MTTMKIPTETNVEMSLKDDVTISMGGVELMASTSKQKFDMREKGQNAVAELLKISQ